LTGSVVALCLLIRRHYPQVGEYHAHEAAHDPARKLWRASQREPDHARKRQRPHPVRCPRQHAIDQVRRGVGSATTIAAGTQAAQFAGERQDRFKSAVRTPHATEAIAKNSTLEIASERALDVARQAEAVR
jgi:hypothetical protein